MLAELRHRDSAMTDPHVGSPGHRTGVSHMGAFWCTTVRGEWSKAEC